MLTVIGAAPGSQTTVDWPKIWRHSHEYQSVKAKFHEIQTSRTTTDDNLQMQPSNRSNNGSYAASFSHQWWFVQKRVAAQYWRTPSYIYSKIALTVASVSIHQTKKTCLRSYPNVSYLIDVYFCRLYSSGSAFTMRRIPSKGSRTRCTP